MRLVRLPPGIPSPTLGFPIAMALVNREFSEVGSTVDVDIRGKRAPFGCCGSAVLQA